MPAMKSYQVMIEGVFVEAPELHGKCGGFHATFFLQANNAPHAMHRVRAMLSERMSKHGVKQGAESYFWAHDVWDITEERFLECEGRDEGFKCFRIGMIERIKLGFQGRWFRKRKPWLLVSP